MTIESIVRLLNLMQHHGLDPEDVINLINRHRPSVDSRQPHRPGYCFRFPGEGIPWLGNYETRAVALNAARQMARESHWYQDRPLIEVGQFADRLVSLSDLVDVNQVMAQASEALSGIVANPIPDWLYDVSAEAEDAFQQAIDAWAHEFDLHPNVAPVINVFQHEWRD